MKPTIAEAKRQCKEYELRLTWNSEFREFCVHVDKDNVGAKHSCEPCYFTDDINDALDTAHDMFVRGLGRTDI